MLNSRHALQGDGEHKRTESQNDYYSDAQREVDSNDCPAPTPMCWAPRLTDEYGDQAPLAHVTNGNRLTVTHMIATVTRR